MPKSVDEADRTLTRRRLVKGLAAAVLAPATVPANALAMIASAASPVRNRTPNEFQQSQARQSWAVPYSSSVLPAGVRSRFVDNANGAIMHTLEAGFETKGRPGVLLLHGFPELAYSWRKVIPRLAAAGYHVMAPDMRGYGRTTGWDVKYDDDLAPYGSLNHTRDMLGLVSAFGYRSVAAVVGHDAGSGVAGWCAIARPDVFRSVVLMSSPFGGPPALPFDTADAPPAGTLPSDWTKTLNWRCVGPAVMVHHQREFPSGHVTCRHVHPHGSVTVADGTGARSGNGRRQRNADQHGEFRRLDSSVGYICGG
jgi:pimeloyl-ACP methyl ester carboxylesterase